MTHKEMIAILKPIVEAHAPASLPFGIWGQLRSILAALEVEPLAEGWAGPQRWRSRQSVMVIDGESMLTGGHILGDVAREYGVDVAALPCGARRE